MGKKPNYVETSGYSSGRLACPRCGLDLVRVQRRLLDRLISLIAPRHRYRCRAHTCQWEGAVRAGATAIARDRVR